jgi:predicted DCC family thiol-disulfide oxidoreductase YuxK
VKSSSPSESSDIIFFDGVCNLCNAFVDFVIRRNSDFKFASLQGLAASKLLPASLVQDLPSVVLFKDGEIFTESTAALKILKRLGGRWFLASVFLCVPKKLRDIVYRFVGRRRYRWFGQRDTCRLPSPEERVRFLD